VKFLTLLTLLACQLPSEPPGDYTLYVATLTVTLDPRIDSMRLIVMGDTVYLTAGQLSTCHHFRAPHGTPLDFSLSYQGDSVGGAMPWPVRTSPNIRAWAQVADGDVPTLWIGWTSVRAPCDSVAG